MRLLLAEDEKELSNALVTFMKRNNYSVDAVYDGQAALEYLESDVYDCVILDIMMPEVDGLTVLKTIRANGNNVPVIILTAKSEIDDRVIGLDAGADDYLTKPFSVKELLARIRSVTRRQTVAEDVHLSYGNLTLDRSTYTAFTDQGSVKLTNKEYQILEMLMATPKRVIPIDRLLEKIWGFDSDTEINVVWVYASYIRRKLKSIGANVQIKASRNLGYSIELIDD